MSYEECEKHGTEVTNEACPQCEPANPAPADGDLVRRLADVIALGRMNGANSESIARAVLAEIARSEPDTFGRLVNADDRRDPVAAAVWNRDIAWETWLSKQPGRAVNVAALDAAEKQLAEARETIARLETELKSQADQLERCRGFLEPLCLELGDIRFTEALPLLRKLKSDLAAVTRERDGLRDALAELHEMTGRGRGHGSTKATLACIVDRLTTRDLDASELEREHKEQVDSLTRELAEVREELAVSLPMAWRLYRYSSNGGLATLSTPAANAEVSAFRDYRARQKPDSGGERACVAVALVGNPNGTRCVCPKCRAQPAPQAGMLALNDALPREQALAAEQDAAEAATESAPKAESEPMVECAKHGLKYPAWRGPCPWCAQDAQAEAAPLLGPTAELQLDRIERKIGYLLNDIAEVLSNQRSRS